MNSADSLTSPSKTNKLSYGFLVVALIGFIDAVWLTVSYYRGHIGCSIIAGCQDVLNSNYSSIFNIPVALLGALFYAFIMISVAHYLIHKSHLSLRVLKITPSIGFLVSLYLIYLQLYVIKAICIYCMLSAATSIIIFILSLILIYKAKTKNNEKTGTMEN